MHRGLQQSFRFIENLDAVFAAGTARALVKEGKKTWYFITADYTFVNERLARHYGFAGVVGNQFRQVTYPDDTRRGILGQGSMLVQTSMANRTSPVLRGKYILENILGTPPSPPPPNIDTTLENKQGEEPKSVRALLSDRWLLVERGVFDLKTMKTIAIR